MVSQLTAYRAYAFVNKRSFPQSHEQTHEEYYDSHPNGVSENPRYYTEGKTAHYTIQVKELGHERSQLPVAHMPTISAYRCQLIPVHCSYIPMLIIMIPWQTPDDIVIQSSTLYHCSFLHFHNGQDFVCQAYLKRIVRI